MLRWFNGKYEHWSIQPDGSVVDMYNSLTTIFECSPQYFFKYMNEHSNSKQCNNLIYYKSIKQYAGSVEYPNFRYSSTYVIKNVIEKISSGNILHLAINNAIRISNFFELQPEVKVYANIGTYGIDGCLSSAIGQAAATDKLCFLIIGDLAFFYDMNALRIQHIGRNLRILLINNRGGGEFYYNGSYINEASDLHTTARHSTKAEGWVRENKFQYLSANNEASLKTALETFFNENSEQSIFLEVFTEMKHDSNIVHEFYHDSQQKDVHSKTFASKLKESLRKVLPNSAMEAVKKIKK